MPLTTYTAGEVLTAASLNANFTFAAANPPGGLTFVSQQTITTATSFSLPASTFTSTYRNYRVIFDGALSAAEQQITLRMRASGSDLTTSNYTGGMVIGTGEGAAEIDATAEASAFDLGKTFAAGQGVSIDVYSPQVATTTKFTGTFFGRISNRGGGAFGGIFSLTTQCDALSIIFAGGVTFTGIVTTYGYANS